MIFRFGYVCPDMFSEADFVISILNSDRETDKNKVHEMCELSSSESRMLNTNYDLFNREVSKCYKLLQIEISNPSYEFIVINNVFCNVTITFSETSIH